MGTPAGHRQGGGDFFSEKIRGAKTFFDLKKVGENFSSGKFFPKAGVGTRFILTEGIWARTMS